MHEIVYLNGEFLPLDEAKISVKDYGFLYGYGLFETMRTYNGKVFRLEAHLDRLAKSAEMLGIRVILPVLRDAVIRTIRKNGLKDARIRLSVSAGEGGMVPDPRSCTNPTVLVVATKFDPPSPEIYEKGYSAMVASIRRNSQSPLSSMKTANYLECLLARQEARSAIADEAILLNEIGLLSEGSMSNIFLVNQGQLKTPPVDAGILPGITRGAVLELASRMGIEAFETDILLRELLSTDEAFLANSLIEVMPLTMINGRPVGTGKPGTVTRRLMEAYKEQVEKECKGKQ